MGPIRLWNRKTTTFNQSYVKEYCDKAKSCWKIKVCEMCLCTISVFHVYCTISNKNLSLSFYFTDFWTLMYIIWKLLKIILDLLGKQNKGIFTGKKNKGKGNGADEKARCTALQTVSLLHTHTLLVQTHNMTTVKESAEKCRQL